MYKVRMYFFGVGSDAVSETWEGRFEEKVSADTFPDMVRGFIKEAKTGREMLLSGKRSQKATIFVAIPLGEEGAPFLVQATCQKCDIVDGKWYTFCPYQEGNAQIAITENFCANSKDMGKISEKYNKMKANLPQGYFWLLKALNDMMTILFDSYTEESTQAEASKES